VAIAELGTASILIEGKGALIAQDNIPHFVEKVNQLLTYPEHRFELGRQAKIYALDKWTAKFQAQRMAHFYSQLIDSQSHKNVSQSVHVSQKNKITADGI
jgi:hypothetical protein